MTKSKKVKSLEKQIYEYLDDTWGMYFNYDKAKEDIMEQFNLSPEDAESYVWNWTIAPKRTV